MNRFGAAFLCWQWLLVAVSLAPTASYGAEPRHTSVARKRCSQGGHEDAALVELEALLRAEPNNLFALGNAGLILGRRGQFSRAAEYLSRAHTSETR